MNFRPLNIALLGTRGIPARYGGFETFAEEIAVRLVERGHHVTVYGRRRFNEKIEKQNDYRGVSLVATPTIMHKYAETPVHALTSFINLAFNRNFDVVLLCNAANSPFAWIARLLGYPLVINVDGIERERRKWNGFGRFWYRLGEYCSVLFASSVVADAKVIADYYLDRYAINAQIIPYGADKIDQAAGATLEKFGLKSKKYLLYVSRLEPENNALGVVEAYSRVKTDLPLVVVGDGPICRGLYRTCQKCCIRKCYFYWISVWRKLSRVKKIIATFIYKQLRLVGLIQLWLRLWLMKIVL